MRITRREAIFCVAGGTVVLALLCYLFIISPAISRQHALTARITREERDLREMMKLRSIRRKLKTSRGNAEKILAARGKGFTLLSFLEGVSRKVGVEDRILYMKPLNFPEQPGPLKSTGIEMKLDRVNTRQLVQLLYRIEHSGKLLNIRRIKIHRSSGQKTPLLKVTLQVNTYRRQGPANK